ncbi:hypothetical protein PISL3812_06178 [Talaromyces islandicus]|uniref:Uncharacterized protein n=1 Tax=Talaromyces islandicus TaxID=28573 RepID=A0A0U1M143_TALIS|nr:hypothetical protein PISL3812_06178 [Talaromyces islandicus]
MPTSTAAPVTSYSLGPISCSNITSCLEDNHLQIATAWEALVVPNNDIKALEQIASSIDSLEAKWMSESEKNNSSGPVTTQASTTKAAVPSCQNEADPNNKQAWCVCSYSGTVRTFSTSQLPGASGRPCPLTAADKLFLPTSSVGPKTITAGLKYPFTTSFENGEVIACATSTSTLVFGTMAVLCTGSSTTISPAPSPTVTLRLDRTPCN